MALFSLYESEPNWTSLPQSNQTLCILWSLEPSCFFHSFHPKGHFLRDFLMGVCLSFLSWPTCKKKFSGVGNPRQPGKLQPRTIMTRLTPSLHVWVHMWMCAKVFFRKFPRSLFGLYGYYRLPSKSNDIGRIWRREGRARRGRPRLLLLMLDWTNISS